MLQIRHGEESLIVENSAGKLEGNAVFPEVRIRLGLVPLELKLAPAHDSLSHTMLSEAQAIVANRDLSEAAFKMEQYFGAMEKSLGTLRGTPEKNPQAEKTARTQALRHKSLN